VVLAGAAAVRADSEALVDLADLVVREALEDPEDLAAQVDSAVKPAAVRAAEPRPAVDDLVVAEVAKAAVPLRADDPAAAGDVKAVDSQAARVAPEVLVDLAGLVAPADLVAWVAAQPSPSKL